MTMVPDASLILFSYGAQNVRVQKDATNEPWWVAADVCDILGLRNSRQALARLDPDEKGVILTDTPGGKQEVTGINEAGLYSLILRSRKPDAKAFKRWVTHEVLPTIRKTGKYDVSQVKDPALQALIAQSKQIEALAIGLDASRQEQAAIKEEAAMANERALQALYAQQWMTIRQYVAVHELTRQFPESEQRQYGRWLTGYCRERGLPIYKIESDRFEEWSYPIWAVQDTLAGWLSRRDSQGPITGLTIHEDGVSYG
jgi:prophage antirepressor-like protein